MIYRIVAIAILLGICVVPVPVLGGGISNTQSIKFSQLEGKVTIHRDEFGTPYIIAENEHDLFFAHGYIQAADRLFQLDGIRRIPKGETAELIGRDQLGMDIWFKKIGLDRGAQLSLENISDKTRFMLETFSEGVNSYIEQNKSTLPLEFKLLGYEPEPWTPYDSLCVMRLIGWWLSVGMYQEMYYDDLIDTYGEEIASEIFPGIPSREEVDKSVKKKKKSKKVFRPTPWRKYDKIAPPRGTNCWVLSGSKTLSGRPILANDPHLELFAPAIWYEIGLSCPEWTVTGVLFPGLPIPQIGTNGKIAWGAASFPADVQDLYMEEVNPDNKHQYKYDGKWRDYEVTNTKVRIKGGKEISVEILRSVNGPVMQKIGKENLSLAWTGVDPSDDLLAFYNAAKSENVEQLQSAFRSFEMIPQHIFAFDLTGDIIHLQPGRIPIRKGFNGDKHLPGGNKKYRWSGYIEPDKMPFSKNPESGFANNSNNFPLIDKGIDLGTTFPLSARFERVREILSSRNDFTMDDMRKMQTDTLNPIARETLPLLLERIKNLDTSDVETELRLLQNWDYDESRESIAATIYNQWWIELPTHLLNKKMGLFALGYRDYMDQYSTALLKLLNDTEQARLWEWLEFESVERFDQLIMAAFKASVKDLKKKYGDDRDDWAWGKVHLTHFAHPSKVEFLVDGGSYGVGGSHYTLNVTHYFPSQGYEATFGASYRFIATIDENNRIIAQSILPPGNWSAPLSRHFKDQIKMWVRGEMKELRVYSDDMSQLPVTAILEHKE